MDEDVAASNVELMDKDVVASIVELMDEDSVVSSNVIKLFIYYRNLFNNTSC
jgi:hypothetical protein